MPADRRLEESHRQAAALLEGASILPSLAGWAYVVTHRRQVLRALTAFEAAYAEMVRLQEEGKLAAEPASFSAEDMVRVRRICELVRSGLHRKGATERAAEIKDLAEHLTRAMTGR